MMPGSISVDDEAGGFPVTRTHPEEASANTGQYSSFICTDTPRTRGVSVTQKTSPLPALGGFKRVGIHPKWGHSPQTEITRPAASSSKLRVLIRTDVNASTGAGSISKENSS